MRFLLAITFPTLLAVAGLAGPGCKNGAGGGDGDADSDADADGDGDGDGDVRAVSALAACEANCDWRASCGEGCGGCSSCAPVSRSDVIDAMVSCFESLPCDGRDDDCENAGFAVLPDAEAQFNACWDLVNAACPDTEVDVSLCLGFRALVDSAREDFLACFDAGCELACADDVFGDCPDSD